MATRFDDDQVTRTHILTIEYNIGYGREFEAQLLGEDCQTPITGTPIDPVQVVRDTYSLTHDTLKLTYILDLNTIAASSIYSSTCEIAWCHVLNLITPGTPNTIEATNEKTLTYDIVPTPEQVSNIYNCYLGVHRSTLFSHHTALVVYICLAWALGDHIQVRKCKE